MPLYEYQCESCANRFERIQKYSDPPVQTCPSCGGPVRKLLSSPAIQFKGTGWYITDYAKKSSSDGSGKGAGTDGAAKTESSGASSDSSSSSAAAAPAASSESKTDSSTKKT
jgi:putative FmdB family regulatory protein